MKLIKTFLLLLVAAAFVVFAVANRANVAVSLFPLPYAADMPLFLFGLLCVALGAIIGGLAMSLRLSKRILQLRHEHQRAEALQHELASLRMHTALPLRP